MVAWRYEFYLSQEKKKKIKARKPREAKELNDFFKDNYNLEQH